MNESLRSALVRMRGRPLYFFLLILVISLGAMIAGTGFSIAAGIGSLSSLLSRGGSRVSIGNCETDRNGILQYQSPPVFSSGALERIRTDVPVLTRVSPVIPGRWNSILVGGTSWRVRNVKGTGHEYPQLMGMKPVAGTFFTADDEKAARRLALLSEETAVLLFGSPENALGKTFEADTGIMIAIRTKGDSGGVPKPRRITDSFTVQGIYETPHPLLRSAYGVPDIIYPWTASGVPGFTAVEGAASIMGITSDLNIGRVREAVRSSLVASGTEEPLLSVWEGDPTQPLSDDLEEGKRIFTAITVLVIFLGLAILSLCTFGIFSMIVLDAEESSREIAIRRSVGAAGRSIVFSLMLRALVPGILGGAIGTLASIPVFSFLVSALFAAVGGNEIIPGDFVAGTVPPPVYGIGFLTVCFFCLLFAAVPAVRAGNRPITDGLKGV